MECAALGVKTDPAKEGAGVGGTGSWQRGESSYHKAASVPLEAGPTASGLGVGRPLLLAQCSEAPGAGGGQGRTGEGDSGQDSCSLKDSPMRHL